MLMVFLRLKHPCLSLMEQPLLYYFYFLSVFGTQYLIKYQYAYIYINELFAFFVRLIMSDRVVNFMLDRIIKYFLFFSV